MRARAAILAVDGGNSKTDVVLVGLDRLGAGPAAAARLRATLTHDRLQPRQPAAASNR